MTDPTAFEHSAAVGGEFPASLGKPATRGLAHAGFTTYAQLEHASAAELLQLHGVGPRAVRILREELARRGLTLAGEPG